MDWADVNVNSNKKGIGSLIIRNCYINTPGDVFVIDNTVFWEECVCENNRIFGLAGTTFYFAYTNEYENNVSNMANCCHIYICGNTFKGTNTANTSGYLGAAVIEARVVIFKDNYLEDIINTATESKGGGTCYDAYLSCQEVYFINNTIKNMMSYSIDNAEKPQCEIGKSKSLQDEGAFNCRVYKDNVWLVDGDYFLSLGAKEEDLYTNYFAFTSPMKNVVIENNVIKYTGKASLNGGVSSHEIEAINFSFNNIDAYEIRGYFFASRQVLTKRYEFVNNKINSRNRALIFRCPTTTGNITVNEKALIKDNVFLGQGAYIDIPETGQVEVYSLEEVTKDIAFGNFFMNSLATAFKGNLKGTIRCDLLDTTKHAYIWLDCSCKVNFTMLLRKIYKANAGHYIYLCNGSSVDVFGFRLVIEYTINGQHYKEDAVIKKAQSLFTVQCGNDIREFEDITTFNYLFEIDSLGLQVNIYASPGTDNNILIRSYILGENPETYNDKYTDISFTIKDV